MDALKNMAQQKAQEYLNKDDDDKHKQQQQEGGYESHGGNYPAGGGAFADDDDDEDDYRHAANEASRHAGSHGDTDLFSSVLGALTQKKTQLRNEDIDEDDAVKKHKKFFGDDDDDEKADDKGLGAAAAMQALKMFSSGETGGQKQSQGGFAGLAMAEASRLFDQRQSQGKVADGASKESAIQQAGEMALKMYFKSQGQQQPGGIMGLASKFIK
ncbi:beta-flanking protein [Colletotrichum tofieldiae]|nr:beta-flanking protein [Colletotrichum tofieldiae]GKT74423.1 beta-flanking protein [Colletotrichum tofieldiae]